MQIQSDVINLLDEGLKNSSNMFMGFVRIILPSFLLISCLNYNQNASPLLGIIATGVTSTSGYTIGGSVSGLTGTGLTLLNNEGDSLTIASDGEFTFSSKLNIRDTYSVRISNQPTYPEQVCNISNGTGTVGSENITSIRVSCSSNVYQVGGTIYNLSGTLILLNNGSDSTSISANGSFTMASSVPNLASYTISIQSQPAGQTCFLSSGSGAVASASVSSIEVNCINSTIAGSLLGGQVVVSNLLPSPLAENAAVGPAFANDYAGLRTIHSLLDGVGTTANFYSPLHMSSDGVNLYIADGINDSVRKIDISSRTVTTLFTVAGLSPRGVTNDGVNLYVTGLDDTIRKFNLVSSTLTTISSTGFNDPRDITTDGSNLYLADTNNHVIKKINIATSLVSTVAGLTGISGSVDDPTGIGGIATFNGPRGLTYYSNALYVSNTAGHNIRKIDLTSNPVKVTTIAGSTAQTPGTTNNATGTSARFNLPSGITCDTSNLFVVDNGTALIRKISLTPPHAVTWYLGCYGSTGSTIASGGPSADLICDPGEANFYNPFGITTDGTSLFVSEQLTHIIRKID